MKHFALILPAVLAGMFATGRVCAQEPSAPKQATDIQLLQKQMLEMQASIQQMQAQHTQEIEDLKAQIAAQQKALDDFQKGDYQAALSKVTSIPAVQNLLGEAQKQFPEAAARWWMRRLW